MFPILLLNIVIDVLTISLMITTSELTSVSLAVTLLTPSIAVFTALFSSCDVKLN